MNRRITKSEALLMVLGLLTLIYAAYLAIEWIESEYGGPTAAIAVFFLALFVLAWATDSSAEIQMEKDTEEKREQRNARRRELRRLKREKSDLKATENRSGLDP